jgi:hypothetical protein
MRFGKSSIAQHPSTKLNLPSSTKLVYWSFALHHSGAEMRLFEYLDQSKTSVPDFARLIGISPEAVRRYLVGERNPRTSVMMEIIRHTNGRVTPNDFVVAPALGAIHDIQKLPAKIEPSASFADEAA